jgi:hypothetical protein
MSRREHRDAEVHIRPDESVVVELDGVVPGFTRWSTVGGIIGIAVALIVPRVLSLPFLAGIVVIVVVLLATFGAIYYFVGRPMAEKCAPPMNGPYLSLVLTDKRLLVIDRALNSDQPELKESYPVEHIGMVQHERAGPISPQRLRYVVEGTDHRTFEFSRSEPVRKLVEALSN